MIVDRSVPGDHAAYMTMPEFEELPDYSHTLPTGQTEGKRWKRHLADGRWWTGEFGRWNRGDDTVPVYWHEIHILTPGMLAQLREEGNTVTPEQRP